MNSEREKDSLETVAPSEEKPLSGDRPRDCPSLPPGYTVGDTYVVTSTLGAGANGIVYEAEHKEIGRRVAIKVVHHVLKTRDDIIARFNLEAKACGTIRSRNVGQVYDVGQLDDGSPYMVMELQEGASLEEMIKSGSISIPIIVEIGRQLLSGLSAAHKLGLVHRDVKPGNVILAKGAEADGGEKVVKLVDFGISKPITPDISMRDITTEGVVIGSPDYMPPEQLRGVGIDHRVDIYAAGVLLYELTTGRRPFDAMSMSELFAAILRDPVTPVRQLRPDCPEQLEGVIMRAISRSKADRYENAAEMAAALASVASQHNLPEGPLAFRQQLSAPADGAAIPEIDPGAVSTVEASAAGTFTPFESRSAFSPGRVIDTLRIKLPVARRWPLIGVAAGAVVALALFFILESNAEDGVTVKQLPSPAPPTAANALASDPIPSFDLDTPEQQPASAEATRATAKTTLPEGKEPPEVSTITPRTKVKKPTRKPATNTSRSRAQKKVTSTPPIDSPKTTVPTTPAESVDSLIKQASAAYMRGQIPLARALYQKAANRAPRNAAAWRGLGMASNRMEQRSAAMRAFERYLKISPNAPDAERIRKKLQDLKQ